MKKVVDVVTEVPAIFRQAFPTLESLQQVVEQAVIASNHTNALMAKILTNLTTVEAAAVRKEIHEIGIEQTRIIGEHLKKEPMFGVPVISQLMLFTFAKIMSQMIEESDYSTTPEQLAMLKGTGAFDKLLRGESQ
jgi:hypothetical protein